MINPRPTSCKSTLRIHISLEVRHLSSNLNYFNFLKPGIGKKFDIRIYVLVTSFSPLVVYIHRNGFCRFSNYQFSIAAKDISNMFIHATNVAIQKTSPQYSADKGCKWLLRNLKMYLMSRHSAEAVDSLFTEMEALIVRSLMCVQRVMIQDKHCFELYGYDVLIDDNLKPYVQTLSQSIAPDLC